MTVVLVFCLKFTSFFFGLRFCPTRTGKENLWHKDTKLYGVHSSVKVNRFLWFDLQLLLGFKLNQLKTSFFKINTIKTKYNNSSILVCDGKSQLEKAFYPRSTNSIYVILYYYPQYCLQQVIYLYKINTYNLFLYT